MSRIFISYRRDDAADAAGRLADHLRERFGDDNVFIDVETIGPGEDFGERIRRDVGKCDILIAVIGRGWLTACHPDGRRRLDSADDYVRLEIATALERNIRVVPVLVQRAPMPKGGELPAALAGLERRNAVEIRETRFRDDVDALIKGFSGWQQAVGRVLRRPAAWAVAGSVMIALAALGALTLPREPPSPPPSLEPLEVRARLLVHPDTRFGEIDRSIPILLGHIAPKHKVDEDLHYLKTSSTQLPFEYSSSVWMPAVKDQPYVGRLERVIERGVLSEVELAQKRKLAAMDICFTWVGAEIKAPATPIVVDCKEGERCRVTSPNTIRSCGDKTVSPTWLAPAHAQESRPSPTVGHEERRWLVPSLMTLRRLKGTPKAVGYSEFAFTSRPLAMPSVNGLGYAIRVNGTPVHIDGWPPEAHRKAFDPSQGLHLEFGLENLDFSGTHAGVEQIDVTLEFLQDRRPVRTVVVPLRYVALRDAAECPVKAADDLTIRWHAQYVSAPHEDVDQIFLNDRNDETQAQQKKTSIDGRKLRLRGSDGVPKELVAVVRPPLDPNPSYGLNLGLRQATGQVKFTFDTATAKHLLAETKPIARAAGITPWLRPVGTKRAVTPCRQ